MYKITLQKTSIHVFLFFFYVNKYNLTLIHKMDLLKEFFSSLACLDYTKNNNIR